MKELPPDMWTWMLLNIGDVADILSAFATVALVGFGYKAFKHSRIIGTIPFRDKVNAHIAESNSLLWRMIDGESIALSEFGALKKSTDDLSTYEFEGSYFPVYVIDQASHLTMCAHSENRFYSKPKNDKESMDWFLEQLRLQRKVQEEAKKVIGRL